MEVRGRDLVSGLPKTIKFSSEDCWLALQSLYLLLLKGLRKYWVTPPELAADIVNNGIVMTGGGSLLDSLDTLLSKETKLPVHIADDAISCVAMGTGRVLNEISVLAQSKGSRSKECFRLKPLPPIPDNLLG